MSDQYNNGFCPQCGALLRNGVCPCCQFGTDSSKNNEGFDGNPYGVGGSDQTDPYGYANLTSLQNAYDNAGQNNTQNMYGNYNSYQNTYQNFQQNPGSYSSAAGANENSKYKVTAAVVGGLLSLFAIVVIVVVSVFSARISESMDLTDKKEHGNDWDYDWDDKNDWDYDWGDDSDNNDYTESLADSIDWQDKTWKKEPENCKPDKLWDSGHRYYEEFKNCIHEDVDYKIVFKTEEKLDKKKSVCMRVTYYQLEGNIPNLKEINRTLRDTACLYMDIYDEEQEYFDDMFETVGDGYIVSATSYVTYHDDMSISIVTNNQYKSLFESGIELDCINIDLETGMIFDNTEIIDPTKEFVKDMVDHSTMQNGSNDFLNNTDVSELQEMFEDENSLIVFYTPCGLEVGLNYTYGFSYGWITTTLTDYEQYLKSY